MKCDVCGVDALVTRKEDGLTLCSNCKDNRVICEVCGKKVLRREMINNKFACGQCCEKINHTLKLKSDPRIIKLRDTELSKEVLQTADSSENNFAQLGKEALSTALYQKNFEILGISQDSSLSAVKERCKLLLQTWHPDLHKNDPVKYEEAILKVKKFKSAYEAITCEKERPYKILELNHGASQKEIQQAFEKLRQIFNPANFNDDSKFQAKVQWKRNEITDAYDELMMQLNGKQSVNVHSPPRNIQSQPITATQKMNDAKPIIPQSGNRQNAYSPSTQIKPSSDTQSPLKREPKSYVKPKGLSWKIFFSAFFIAVFLNALISVATGVEPKKNITWTVFWIYFTIDGWKYLQWKALLPYPVFIVVNSVIYVVMASSSEDYIWLFIGLLLILNIGGLFAFSSYISKAKRTQY